MTSSGADVVLHAGGHTGQRADGPSCLVLVQCFGLCQGLFGQHGDEGVVLRPDGRQWRPAAPAAASTGSTSPARMAAPSWRAVRSNKLMSFSLLIPQPWAPERPLHRAPARCCSRASRCVEGSTSSSRSTFFTGNTWLMGSTPLGVQCVQHVHIGDDLLQLALHFLFCRFIRSFNRDRVET